jgi:DNA-directed RNA polymerase subunit beta
MTDRISFGKIKEVLEVPDLIGIQTDSYVDFLQREISPEKRKNQGLQEVLKEIFPIESFDQQCVLDFVRYELGEPKIPLLKCLKDGGTYASPLHVVYRLQTPRDTKEETVYMGDIPLMTDSGSFVINGAARVIISQLHRSPGICFEKTRHPSGRMLYSYRVIPDRGSWMEVQFDINDLIFIYLDRRRRRRKFLISTFLRALGYGTNRELLDGVYGVQETTPAKLAKSENLAAFFTVEAVMSEESPETVVVPELEPLNLKALDAMRKEKVKKLFVVDTAAIGDYFVGCVKRDPAKDSDEALKEIYRRLRPGDPPNVNNAKQLLKRLFFSARRYDLGLVGRHKINQKLGLNVPSDTRTLAREDLVGATQYLMKLRGGNGDVDDIDHLGSRRIRTVGELMQNQCRVGLLRTERLVRERMTLIDMESEDVAPGKLINPKAFAGVIRDFFARNQLSQYMDQTNALAELTNKRRLSALGPGGLTRERAGFEVRDVHASHYGRVCPIETPEGPNIGLISSLSLYARVNSFGFIETPYRRVEHGVVTEKIDYLTADVEEKYIVAQANAKLDEKGRFATPTVLCRKRGGDFAEFPADKVDYMDVSPKQLVSAAAGMVPFLEHNDANRALMGSNMQRQAVPLIRAEAPLVGTGLEFVVARDSRAVVCATLDGIVASSNAERVITTKDGKMPEETKDSGSVREYVLQKFLRSNASTPITQRPIVMRGDKIKKGQVIADGASTDKGEMSIGRNLTVAYLPWCGYNFEDAIVLSERLVKEDIYTSINIAEFDITARDTKLGPEEITRDIPNIGEEALRNLDSEGIIRIGAEVKPGDILVGKITPKGETELAPEERLLRAIFGEKAADVKDSSLYVPSGTDGIIMDVRTERKVDPTRQKASKAELKKQVADAENGYRSQFNELVEELTEKLAVSLLGSKLTVDVVNTAKAGEVLVPANRKITKVMLRKVASNCDTYKLPAGPAKEQIDEAVKPFRVRFHDAKLNHDEIIARLQQNEGADPGVIKSVKVYIASRRKISVGDKMAGRHGNKGIVARIVPVEDLPFMADGTPVDIVLNPLGVPSRMNVGQVLEAHLGWAAKILGMKIASPVFDGIHEENIHELLVEAKAKKVKEAGWKLQAGGKVVDQDGRDRSACFVDVDGKTCLFDGRTGDRFAQRVVVGQTYMLKLDHMVVDKIHARAVGPYSLVTQQPLGGKAQHGGQRFGEMEVWALEAYGAAHILQEMLTVKSDDVAGRTRIYEAILRGENSLEAGTPESFNVLMKEMQSLCLDIRVRRGRVAEQ